MRTSLRLRQNGAVGAVDRGKYGILPVSSLPPLADRVGGDAHGVRGLVTGYASSPVRSEFLKEGVVASSNGPINVIEKQFASMILKGSGERERIRIAGFPPELRPAVLSHGRSHRRNDEHQPGATE